MMRSRIAPLLFVFSIALNLAFIVAWGAQALRSSEVAPADPVPASAQMTSRECKLHQQLGTTDAEWAQIAPLLEEFQRERCSLCRELDQARSELIDALAAPVVDRELIASKQTAILAAQGRMQNLIVDQLLSVSCPSPCPSPCPTPAVKISHTTERYGTCAECICRARTRARSRGRERSPARIDLRITTRA